MLLLRPLAELSGLIVMLPYPYPIPHRLPPLALAFVAVTTFIYRIRSISFLLFWWLARSKSTNTRLGHSLKPQDSRRFGPLTKRAWLTKKQVGERKPQAGPFKEAVKRAGYPSDNAVGGEWVHVGDDWASDCVGGKVCVAYICLDMKTWTKTSRFDNKSNAIEFGLVVSVVGEDCMADGSIHTKQNVRAHSATAAAAT